MKILVLQETDWLTRGPHTQHHIFERLSKNPLINIVVLDYDIDKIQKSNSLFIKTQVFSHINRVVRNSNVKIIRTAHIQIPYIRRMSSLITNFFEILRIIKKKKPDIIVSFSMTNGFIGLLFSKIFNIPYIFYYIDILHTLVPISFAKKIARIITRFLCRFSDQLIVVTKSLYNLVLKEGAPPNKVKILLNGISLENTKVNIKKYEALKKNLSISDDDFILLFMGYLYEFAGLQEIIDYYHQNVSNGKYHIKFLIVGDGGIYNNLLNYVKKINANWVILTGKVPFFDLTEYIELADLCLMSFKLNEITRNITPVKIMEYMAMKKPVLSNTLPGIVLELGGKNGIIFAENQNELIRMIGSLYYRRDELLKIGKKGYELIINKYTWTTLLKDLKEIILNLIKNKK